jgi:hypothetical protein
MDNSSFEPQNNEHYDTNQPDDLEIKEQISPRKRQEFQKLFLILLTIGLVLGVIASVGIVKLMNNLGLTEKTPQFERIQK